MTKRPARPRRGSRRSARRPAGTPCALVAQRDWDDYSFRRADALQHLGALVVVYAGIIEAHRTAIGSTEDLDLVTGDSTRRRGCAHRRSFGKKIFNPNGPRCVGSAPLTPSP